MSDRNIPTDEHCAHGIPVNSPSACPSCHSQASELETLRMQLAGCGVGAQCNTPESAAQQRVGPDSPYYCASIADVYRAVDREMALRALLKRFITAWEGGDENMDRLCEIARGLT